VRVEKNQYLSTRYNQPSWTMYYFARRNPYVFFEA